MRGKIPVLLVTFVLLAAACGSDDGDGANDTASNASTTTTASDESTTTSTTNTEESSTTTSTTEEPVELTASWPGVTEDSIRLGFLDVDYGKLEELGLYQSNFGDPKAVIEALVNEVNARGGINGRQIEPFVELYNPVDVVDAEEVCLRLTEDRDVFAVLGVFAGPTEPVNGCFTDLGATAQVGGVPTPEDLEQANAPWYAVNFTDERSARAGVALLDQEGAIAEPLAVVWAPEDEVQAQDFVIPELEASGYEIALAVVMEASSADRQALDSEWGTIVERFRADGITTALLVGSAAAFNGSNQLALHEWEGATLVGSYQDMSGIGGTGEVPLEELAGILGPIGATSEESWELEATQDCVAIFSAANPDEVVKPVSEVLQDETNWATPLIAHCQFLRLFELIATAAGPDLTHESFVAGAESLGEFELPGIPLASLGPGKIDANDAMRLGVFDPTLGEFGRGAPAGELVRVP